MAASKIVVSQGVGTNLATHEITETALQVHLSRTVLNDAAGVTVAPLTDTQLRATPLFFSEVDNTSNGTLTAISQTVVLAMGGKSASAISVSGTWVGTITFEGTVDGTIWNPINAVAASTSQPQPTTTVNGLYRLSPAGLLQIRANMTAFTSGTASISIRVSSGTGGVFVNQILPSKITDGINTVTIKPASTPAGVTDLPLVVALHPSSTTPNFTAAQPVTGTFFQATQPVSIASTITDDVTDRAGRLLGIVTSSSIASVIPTTTIMQNASVAVGNGTNLNVNGYASSILNITGNFVATLIFEASVDDTTFVAITGHQIGVAGNLSTSTTIIGDYRINTAGYKSVRARVSSFTSGSITVKGYASVIAGHPTTINSNITTAPLITKNTQGTTGFSTQDLKDSGRSHVTFYALVPVLSTATDTLQTLTATRAGATVTATTTPAVVTTGKTFRVTKISASYVATAVSGFAMVRFRFNNAGLVSITSPISTTFTVGSDNPATANASDIVVIPFSEGMEFASGTGVGFSVQGFAAATPTATGYVLVSVIGYEY